MKRRLREPFGKAGLTVAIVALVFAMVGGAFAAGALTGKQKKEVAKIATKEAKKFANSNPGAPGANGTNGTPGAKGDTGSAGTNGTNGAPGTSVTNTSLAKGSVPCPEGGAEFKVGAGAATKACNGTTGFTDTLPSGKTETGAVALYDSKPGFEQAIAISFSIPLAAPAGGEKAFVLTAKEIEEEEGPGIEAGCTGTAKSPTAPPGILCVYISREENVFGFTTVIFAEEAGYQRPGTVIHLNSESETATLIVEGSWAVTAP